MERNAGSWLSDIIYSTTIFSFHRTEKVEIYFAMKTIDCELVSGPRVSGATRVGFADTQRTKYKLISV